VPADQQEIVAALTALYNSCAPMAASNPVKRREMEDNSKKIGTLFWRLNAGQVSTGVIAKLNQLCAAIKAGDWQTANHIQLQMTASDWDECGLWLAAIKRLIKSKG